MDPQLLQATVGNRVTAQLLRSAAPVAASASPVIRRSMEKEFNKDPAAFMASNQVLVAFQEGVHMTSILPEGALAGIRAQQERLSDADMAKVNEREKAAKARNKLDPVKNPLDPDDDFGKSVALKMKSPEAVERKGQNYLTQLMETSMRVAKCEHFTLAARTVGTWPMRRTQYIVTPMLETLIRTVPADATTVGPDGTQIPLTDALNALKRSPSQMYDAVIEAAYIPYESNPNLVTGDTSAKLRDTGPKVAFTAAMNGCSLAIRRDSPTELTVWHFPSPGSNPALWETFKEEQNIGQSFDWDTYNDLSDDDRYRLLKNHATTTIMVRDDNGWKITSQQNVNKSGPDQRTELLKIGKLAEARVDIGHEGHFEVEHQEPVQLNT